MVAANKSPFLLCSILSYSHLPGFSQTLFRFCLEVRTSLRTLLKTDNFDALTLLRHWDKTKMSSASLPVPCIEGDKGNVNIGIGATFLAICVITTFLRIYTRMRRVTAGFGMDDVFILIAVVSQDLDETRNTKLTKFRDTCNHALCFK